MSREELESSASASESPDGEILNEYRPVSRLSLVALFFGLAAALAFADPLMIVVPVIGVVVAAFALWHLRRSRVAMLGRTAALAGLALSLLFGTWSLTRYVSRQHMLYQEAAEVGQAWLELVRDGKLYEAHQLQLSQTRRAAPGASLADLYQDPVHGQAGFQKFRSDFLGPRLAQLDPNARIRLESNEQAGPDGRTDLIVQHFEIDTKRESLIVQLTLKRTPLSHVRESQWEVVGLSFPSTP